MVAFLFDTYDFKPVEGAPDLAGTRRVCIASALSCAVFAIWLPLASLPRISEADSPALVVSLIMAMTALMLGLIVLLVRTAWRPGAWFRVTAQGIEYGSGPWSEDPMQRAGAQQIEWTRIVRNPERSYDIGIASEVYRVAPSARMTFWYRDTNGGIVERSLPLQLRDDALRCLRFCNAQEVRVALLRRLAANPGLRFDPEVFVRAGLDPETWKPMSAPHRASWLAVSLVMACIMGFAAVGAGQWSSGKLAIGTVAIFVTGLVLYVRWWPQAYPRVAEIITFEPASPSVRE